MYLHMGMHPYADYCQVLLDEQPVADCIAAHEEEGWVECYARGEGWALRDRGPGPEAAAALWHREPRVVSSRACRRPASLCRGQAARRS